VTAKDPRGASRRGIVTRALRSYFSRWVTDLQADTPKIWNKVEEQLGERPAPGGGSGFQVQPMQQQQQKKTES
jgi:hypothetical protein